VARDLDEQLLESVSVRRRRLVDALLWGAARQHRAMPDNVARLLVGVVVAALLCAGCVGWSFLRDALAEQQARQQQIGSAEPWGQAWPATPA
jgi:hypothetical protein